MVRLDEDALVCDLAETYGIFDYRRMSLRLVARLAAGLGEKSRIWRKANGHSEVPVQMLLVLMADQLRLLTYLHTRDAEKGRNRPKPIFNTIYGEKDTSSEIVLFDSGEAFRKAWRNASREVND